MDYLSDFSLLCFQIPIKPRTLISSQMKKCSMTSIRFLCVLASCERLITLKSLGLTKKLKFYGIRGQLILRFLNSSDQEEQTVLGKYPSLCGKFAVLFHLVAEAEGCNDSENFQPSLKIAEESLEMAIKWVKLLWSHNKRIQHFGKYCEHDDKAELFLKRLTMIKSEPFQLREVYRGAMHGLKTAKEARIGANELVERGYLKIKTVSVARNRNKVWYFRHPDLVKQIKQ
jgi:hypothetical protein